ncbi:MAG TPA: DUF1326 domain-containing protein [Gaiellaceae bacterium]|nr:DUF1326 domain-containing protein [Gaiellaceae bacterium]
MSWRIEGDYFESCNCEAICPCRMVGGVAGGRSTYGICLGALSWRVESGERDGVDLSGLAAALVCRYDDDEPGSPWRFVLHVDARGDDGQRAALEDILLGRAGGEQVLRLPWVRKPSELLAVRASEIELGGGELRVADAVRLRATRPVESEQPVRCGIPGYDEPGEELYADELTVHDGELRWELAGNCAFRSRFAYSG